MWEDVNRKKSYNKYMIENRVNTARYSAKKKGIDFNLTKEWFIAKVDHGVCEVTGLSFEKHILRAGTQPFTPSIDRIDSNKGYTKDNCRVVCAIYNIAKKRI